MKVYAECRGSKLFVLQKKIIKTYVLLSIKVLLFIVIDIILMTPFAFLMLNIMQYLSLTLSTLNMPAQNLPWKRKQTRCWIFLISVLIIKILPVF